MHMTAPHLPWKERDKRMLPPRGTQGCHCNTSSEVVTVPQSTSEKEPYLFGKLNDILCRPLFRVSSGVVTLIPANTNDAQISLNAEHQHGVDERGCCKV